MEVGVSTVTVKGQVTIPKEIREIMGIAEGDRIIFQTESDNIVIKKIPKGKLSDVLNRQKPWGESGVEFQRGLREEWLLK